jgi:tRNA(Ile)-lysidine synthase
MPLTAAFREALQSIADTTNAEHTLRFILALSGGLDSRVMLHLCRQAGIDFRVVHIHHGLQTEADDWNRFCAQLCDDIDAPYVCIHVDAQPKTGESPEEAARIARYRGLLSQMQPDDVLLTAHHLDDQAETLLLQLMRGAGPAGLAAMPLCKPFGPGWHARPMLKVARMALTDYAQLNKLEWLVDPSNSDTSLDRNYIRHRVMPVLAERWSNAAQSLESVAHLQQDAAALQDDLAEIDRQAFADADNALYIPSLLGLSRARCLNLLRYWINSTGIEKPRRNILNEIIDSVLPAADDAAPMVMWGLAEVRRYRNRLYLMRALTHHALDQVYAWDGETPLLFDSLGFELRLEQVHGEGLLQDTVLRGLTVRFRQGGENIRPKGRDHSHSLKKLMQEAGIPPWQRNRIPLIYTGNILVCVCGYWVAAEFAAGPEQQGWLPRCRELGS